MENAKLEIVRFDNADVIATSSTVTPVPSVFQQFLTISGMDHEQYNLKFTYSDSKNKTGDSITKSESTTPQNFVGFVQDHYGVSIVAADKIFDNNSGSLQDVSTLYSRESYGLDQWNGIYEFIKDNDTFVWKSALPEDDN